MACPACGNVVAVTDQFCPKCFARLEPPGRWRTFLSWFRLSFSKVQAPAVSRRPLVTIKKTINIRTTDKDGAQHDYHSLDELPPEIRAEIEKLEADALKEKGGSTSVTETLPAGIMTTSRTFIKKNVSIFKIKDASGNEQIYHSLEEMPPAIRAAIEKAQDKTD